MTRGSAPSSVEEVQAAGRKPATTAIRPRRAGTQRGRSSLGVIHPWAGPLLRLHLGPPCCYREEAHESLRAVMGPPPTQSLPFPRLDSSPFWSPSRLLLHMPQQRNFSFTGPPFWNLGEQPAVPWGIGKPVPPPSWELASVWQIMRCPLGCQGSRS